MKVILSVDSIRYPLTGIGRYTYELAMALARNDQVTSLRFFHGTRLCATLPQVAPSSPAIQGLRTRLKKSRFAVGVYQCVVPGLKKLRLRRVADHVFHGSNFYLPPFSGRSVATIHDLSPYCQATCHPPERVRYMRSEIELALGRATLLLTDSEFTRREVAHYFGWPLEKVYAVPLASAPEFHTRKPSEIEPVLARYGLTAGGYCLFVGTIEPRKNIDRLLDAYDLLPAAVRRQWPLILAGHQGWKSEALRIRMAAAQDAGWLHYLDFVPTAHLPALYSGARLFTFPSLYEGFGLPVLEAMASGVPVVCSNSSSLPEVAGDAAALCEALDVDALSQLIAMGLQDAQWRHEAIRKGLIQAARFSWQRCADATVVAYQAALRL